MWLVLLEVRLNLITNVHLDFRAKKRFIVLCLIFGKAREKMHVAIDL